MYLVVDLDHETETVPLKFVLIVERLDDFKGTGAVVVAHHCELVGTESTALNHLIDVDLIKMKSNHKPFIMGKGSINELEYLPCSGICWFRLRRGRLQSIWERPVMRCRPSRPLLCTTRIW